MTSNEFPELFVIEPSGKHTHTAVLIHGRGGSGPEHVTEMFETHGSSNQSLRDLFPGYRWLFPSAKSLYSQTFQEHINQWYDVRSLSDPEANYQDQLSAMRDSIALIQSIIAQAKNRAPSGKVILCGVSQGFSIAVLAAMIDSSNLEALVGYSSWLPMWSQIKALVDPHTRADSATLRSSVAKRLVEILGVEDDENAKQPAIPVFLAHCANDTTIDIKLGRKMNAVLASLGHEITWVESEDGGHWINEPDGIDELVAFLQQNALN